MNWVVDASALIASMIESDRFSAEALSAINHLRATQRAIAPPFLQWEIGNAVHRRRPLEFGPDSNKRAIIVVRMLEGIRLEKPNDEGLRRTGTLAERFGISFYDASYLELAAREKANGLLTLDTRLAEAARTEILTERLITGPKLSDGLPP